MSKQPTFKWTEQNIGRAIAYQFFKRSVVIVPNCHWTGHEADLLVVHKDLRIIDIEIKISRQDLKADLTKDKWWKSRPWSRRHLPKERRAWPDKVWKHYYAMPAEIWDDKLLAFIPETSGVLLVRQDGRYDGGVYIWAKKPAKPCREAKPITPADAVDIARLASLRMWTALTKD
jgi:hypothetical protein